MMKKLFSILLFSLLFSLNVYAEKIPDMTNSTWEVKLGSGVGSKYKLHFKPNGECTYGYWDVWNRTFKDCNWTQNGNKVDMLGNHKKGNPGFTIKLTVSGYNATGAQFGNSDNELYKIIKTGQATHISNWLTTTSNTTSTTSSNNKIAQSKKICKELGFKVNSEKFADCALKMMAMQFETGNKVSNNDGSSTQQIIVKQQDDFDIGDFFFGLQKIVDDNYRSTNNSSNQSTNCRIVPKAWGADMVCR